MNVEVDQALYGYDRGHRLIVTSTPIEKESGRTLRSVTDLKVGSSSHSYLTVLPLPAMRRHAFIRTWSAGPGFRPGSVWSHVLLMYQEDLDHFVDFRAVLQRFCRPDVDSDLPSLRTRYDTPLLLEPSGNELDAPWSPSVARQLVAAAYETAEPTEVVVERADVHDHLFLALLGQMWPELRRTFGFRTRHRRVTSTVANFAIEVVEQASTRRPAGKPPAGTWVDVLARDLEIPDEGLRDWLWNFGPDGPADRQAVAPLVRIFAAARTGVATDVINELLAAYPQREQMGSLKADLFGASTPVVRFAMWPTAEARRLPLALGASSALDLDRLQVQDRLTTLARTDPARLLGVFDNVDWETLDQAGRDSLIAALAHGLEPTSLASVAISRKDLTVPLLSARPDTWHQSEVWSNPVAADVVRSLLAEATDDERAATLERLIATGQLGPAIELCENHPTLWWSLLGGDVANTLRSSQVAVDTIRAVFFKVSRKAVGPPPFALATMDQLAMLVRVTDPDDGLWKSADAAAWLDVVERVRNDGWNNAQHEVFNTQVVALAAAEASCDLRLREATWWIVFGDMHRYMASFGAPNGTERTLSRMLPGGPKSDWCARLRDGLARVAVDGDWKPERIHAVASDAGDFAGDVAIRVKERTNHKNEGFLEGLKSIFRV